MRRTLHLLVALLLTSSCQDEAGPLPSSDAEAVDDGASDASDSDTGNFDLGPEDGGPSDVAIDDGGGEDGSPTDGGAQLCYRGWSGASSCCLTSDTQPANGGSCPPGYFIGDECGRFDPQCEGVDGGPSGQACGPSLRCNPVIEVCVATSPIGPSIRYSCEAVPSGCEVDRSCACVQATLCESPFDVCVDVELNQVSCECPQCQ